MAWRSALGSPSASVPVVAVVFEDQLVSGEVPGVLPVIEPICPV